MTDAPFCDGCRHCLDSYPHEPKFKDVDITCLSPQEDVWRRECKKDHLVRLYWTRKRREEGIHLIPCSVESSTKMCPDYEALEVLYEGPRPTRFERLLRDL